MEKQKKPTGIKAILILNCVSIGIILLLIVLLSVIASLPESNNFKIGFISAAGGSLSPEDFARMTGGILFQTVFPALTIAAVLKRKYRMVIVFLVLQVLTFFRGCLNPLTALICLIILLSSVTTRNYLKRKN